MTRRTHHHEHESLLIVDDENGLGLATFRQFLALTDQPGSLNRRELGVALAVLNCDLSWKVGQTDVRVSTEVGPFLRREGSAMPRNLQRI